MTQQLIAARMCVRCDATTDHVPATAYRRYLTSGVLRHDCGGQLIALSDTVLIAFVRGLRRAADDTDPAPALDTIRARTASAPRRDHP